VKETLKNVNHLYDKIDELLNKYDSLKIDNKKIKEDLQLLQLKLKEKEKDYAELKEKYNSLKLVNAMSPDGESVLAKKKIRKMIDDIDDCILNLMG
jgi:chromosome segregation ATPase